MNTEITFDEWIKVRIENNWCGAPVCYTHDGLPTTIDEDNMFDEGDDPCMHIVRLYEDQEMKIQVEDNHSPSKWRNHYTQ